MLNAKSYLERDGFKECIEARVETPEFTADAVSVHTLHRDARILKRTRTWSIPGQPDIVDDAEYRLLYPEEVSGLLEGAGFEVVGMYDNRDFKATDLAGSVTGGSDCGGMLLNPTLVEAGYTR